MPGLCRYILLLLLYLAGTGRLSGADSAQYLHYTIDNGLPSNNVYSCIQDHNGYMWFTTDKGAVKYNGYTFEVFNTTHGGLPSDDVYQLVEDKTGRIWVYCTTNHMGYLKNSRYTELQLPKLSYEYKKEFDRVVLYDSLAAFVALTDNPVVLAFSGPRSNYFFTVPTPYFRFLVIPPYIIVLNYSGRGMLKTYRIYDLRRYPFSYKPSRLFFNERKLLNTHSPTYVYDQYLYRYSRADDIICRIDFVNRKILFTSLKSYGKNDSVTYLGHFRKGATFLITKRYLYEVDTALALKKPPVPVSDYFPNSQLSFIFDDRSGARWCMSTTDGILQTAPGIIPRISDIRGTSSTVRLVGASGSASFWFDHVNSLLYHVDSSLRYWSQATGLSNIHHIEQVNEHTAIISNTGPLMQLDLTSKSIRPFFDHARVVGIQDNGKLQYATGNIRIGSVDPSLPQANLKTFKYTDSNIVINSTWGLLTTSWKHDTLTYYHRRSNQYLFTTKHNFFGRFLFYNHEGAAIFNPVNDSITTFYFKNTGWDALRKVNQVCIDKYSNVYFLNDKNLLRLNPFRMQWKVLSRYCNMEDARLDISENKIVLAGRFGIAAAQICGPDSIGNFFLTPNVKYRWYRQANDVWLADNGQAMIRTNKHLLTIHADSLLAQGINSDRDSVTAFHLILKRPSEKPIYNGDTILLEQEKSSILLDAINFLGSGTVNYKYLLPAEKNYWQQTLSGDIFFSAAIKPGVYYPLQLQISDDMWKSDKMLVYLYIPPYWYQTHNARVFFLIAGSLIFILAIIGGISLTRQAVIRAQAKRRALTELELRAVHSQINPHFIFNTLSTALYFIDRRDYDNAYKHVNKFSHLLRSYLKSSHDRYVLLSEEIDMLRRYIELQQVRFEHLFTYGIKVENRVPADHIQIPSLLLQPLVENAINHGLFHRKEPGGRLLITFAQGNTSDELICIIEDNGIGRMRAMDMKKQNDAERQSYGSKLTDKLVDIFRQYEAMNIHIEYIDKIAPETGTTVRLTIGNVKYVV